jgi:cation transport ATPase
VGILVHSRDALERLARADTVVFDKTGTLTERFARVGDVASVPGVADSRVLGMASAVEAESDHPIAGAIGAAAAPIGPATDVQILAGAEVVGVVEGHRVSVGRLNGDAVPGALRASRRSSTEATPSSRSAATTPRSASSPWLPRSTSTGSEAD